VPELRRSDLAEDPLEQFRRWFEEARGAVRIPEAMALATAAADGDPSVRMVLLKGADERGFAALLTLAPQFSDWAIRREAAETAANAADQLAARVGIVINANEPDPRGRGVVVRWRGGQHYPVAGTVAIDAGGTVGARLGRDPIGEEGSPNRFDRLSLGAIHQRHILPLVGCVCEVLHRAEATGRTTWRLDIILPPNFRIGGTARTPRRFYASAQVTLPADDDAQKALARQWSREYARESGLPEWHEG
jgi:hypothetical protein